MRVLWVVACAWSVHRADAHGGLTIPVPRNNYGNVDPANWFVDLTTVLENYCNMRTFII